jgi:iron complex transport system ATP-binding protein
MTSTSELAVPRSVLRATRISVRLGGRPVLTDVDLDLHVGEWLGVIGPNGGGKSTLLRALSGRVPCAGKLALGDGRALRPTMVSLMPQSPVLPVGMTVVEYVLVGRTAHLGWLRQESRRDREIAVGVLRRLGLAQFADRRVRSLSGGEAQRVVVARALAQQAPILLLDEPTSALDVGHEIEVLELVDDLRRSDGLTIVAAMHDLTVAARFADRLALVQCGGIVALGTPRDVLDAELISRVYRTPLQVHEIHDDLVVMPAPRPLTSSTATLTTDPLTRRATAALTPGRTDDH